MFFEIIAFIFIFYFLAESALMDLRIAKIPAYCAPIIAVLGLCLNIHYFIPTIIIGGALWIVSYILFKKKMWGGGDADLFVALGMVFAPVVVLYVFVILSCIIAYSIGWYFKNKNPDKVRLVPAFLMALCLTLILL